MVEPVINTIGCGDSFFAGLIVSLQKGLSLTEACLFGTACGAANTFSRMPASFSKEELKKCIKVVHELNKDLLHE